MKKNKIIKIEAVVLVVMWLIVAIFCFAYIFNEEPEDAEDFKTNMESDEDSPYFITPWFPVNDTFVNGTYVEE